MTRRIFMALSTFLTLAACSGSNDHTTPAATGDGGMPPATGADAGIDSGASADWALTFDASATAGPLPPALLGQYDLSGALFHYDQVPELPALMKTAGLAEWRVGVGRWEFGTQLLPALTDGTPCNVSAAPAQALAPAGTTDLDLIKARDWFTYTDGAPVTMAMTADDSRYNLAYVRSVLDVVDRFGAAAYLGIDHMPRALAANQTPARTSSGMADPCSNPTWSNKVSNVRPADPAVFAAAVVGLVKRIVEGSGGAPGRPVRYWEFWNEPELSYAWDPTVGDIPSYFQAALMTLTALDGYRKQTANADGKAIRIGLGSFALGSSAATVLQKLDAPYDFVSFHEESDDDPLVIGSKIQEVVDARKTSSHPNAELLLTEWSQSLTSTKLDPTTMDVALHHATVIALGATAGLTHMHHAIFWDFYSKGLPPLGIIDHDRTPLPAYHAYALLARVIGTGSSRLAPTGSADGKLDGGMGMVLASKDGAGQVRVLFINRSTVARTASVGATPTAVTVFDDATRPPHVVAPSDVVTIPSRSIVLVER